MNVAFQVIVYGILGVCAGMCGFWIYNFPSFNYKAKERFVRMQMITLLLVSLAARLIYLGINYPGNPNGVIAWIFGVILGALAIISLLQTLIEYKEM